MENTPGVTRDRLYHDVEWSGRVFTLVDTGGIVRPEIDDIITGQVQRQVRAALQEADILVLVVDAREGILPGDEEIAEMLRREKKPAVIAANKVEDFTNLAAIYQYYSLGLGEPVPVSAAHGQNTGELLDRLVQIMPPVENDTDAKDVIKLAVVGRPNVGKSSLVNLLLGEEKQIVTDIPGTTRDTVDSFFRWQGHNYMVMDTAGMRRKARISGPTERYSVIRALRAVDRCDVALIVLDALENVTEQDKRIAGYVYEKGKAAVLVVNKWDLVDKTTGTMQEYEQEIRRRLTFLDFIPVNFISALTGKRVPKLLETVELVAREAIKKINTSVFNDLIGEAVAITPPPAHKGRRLKFFYGTQVNVQPPTFVLFVNDPGLVHFSYCRYLENQIRDAFGFTGTPLRLLVRGRGNKGK